MIQHILGAALLQMERYKGAHHDPETYIRIERVKDAMADLKKFLENPEDYKAEQAQELGGLAAMGKGIRRTGR